MSRLIIIIAIALSIYLLNQEAKKLPTAARKKFYVKSGFWALFILLVILAASGRLHWISVVIAAAIPIIKTLLGLLVRVLPFLQMANKHQTNTSQPPPPLSSSDINEEEAWQILGLEPDSDKDAIIQAHKRLMQKIHPDRGGNDYLATRINQAKDLLLEKLS